MPTRPTGTVSFLFTDIEGSTRLWETSAAAMARAVVQHDAILRAAIADNHGYVFSTSGDGLAAAFQRAQEAVSAALQAQLALAAAEWEVPSLRVRMAVHTGEAEERGGDYFGPALNETGRLLGSGHGGQVLVSGVTREVVGVQLTDGADMRDLGEHLLRDVTRPLRIFQLVHPQLAPDFPPLRTADRPRSSLPTQITSLVGRDVELVRVDKLLREGRLLTLMGAGGCGKTRLAVETATRWQLDSPGEVWFVDLTSVSEPELLLSTINRAVGLVEANEGDALERLLELLRPKSGLLVLDNCEHLRDAVAAVVAAVVREAPGLKMLATSRESLGLQGEVVWEVPPLPIPALDTPVGEMLQFAAVRLFEARAAAAQPEFQLTEANADAVKRICRRLDGIPLGIELAAARLRVLSPDDIARRLEDSLAVLGSAGRDVVPHHRTLEATLEWSYSLLGTEERALFERLAVFAGGWNLEAAEQVGGDAVGGVEAVLDVLSSLVDKSLIVVTDSDGSTRYRLLEPVRQYARGKLAASGATEARQRHAAHFAALVESAYPRMYESEDGLWLDRLEADIDNLRESLAWHLETGTAAPGQLMAGALMVFWLRTRRDEEGIGWQERLLACDDTPGQARARTLLLSNLHRLEDAEAHHLHLDEALAMYREFGPERELIIALRVRANHADATGEVPRAVALFEEALTRARALGETGLVAMAAVDLASIQIRWVGDLAAAAPLVAEGLATARKLGSPVVLYIALMAAADLEESRGDLVAASAFLAECLDLERPSGSRLPAIGYALERLAEIAVVEGRLDDALSHLADQHQQIESLNYGEVRTRNPLRRESLRTRGEIEVARGNHARGVTLLAAHAVSFAPQRLEKHRQERFDAALNRARNAIGDDAFNAAWSAGTAMSLDEALRYGASG